MRRSDLEVLQDGLLDRKPAAAVTRNSRSETPDRNTFSTDSRNGSATTTIMVVIAAALRRMTAPTATASTATTATSAAVPATTLMSVSAEVGSRNWPWFSSLGTPCMIATASTGPGAASRPA